MILEIIVLVLATLLCVLSAKVYRLEKELKELKMSNKPYLENEIKALKYQLLIEKQKHKKTKEKVFKLKNIQGEKYEKLKAEFAKNQLFVFRDDELFLWVESLMRELKTKILCTNDELSKKACDILVFKLEKRRKNFNY